MSRPQNNLATDLRDAEDYKASALNRIMFVESVLERDMNINELYNIISLMNPSAISAIKDTIRLQLGQHWFDPESVVDQKTFMFIYLLQMASRYYKPNMQFQWAICPKPLDIILSLYRAEHGHAIFDLVYVPRRWGLHWTYTNGIAGECFNATELRMLERRLGKVVLNFEQLSILKHLNGLSADDLGLINECVVDNVLLLSAVAKSIKFSSDSGTTREKLQFQILLQTLSMLSPKNLSSNCIEMLSLLIKNVIVHRELTTILGLYAICNPFLDDLKDSEYWEIYNRFILGAEGVSTYAGCKMEYYTHAYHSLVGKEVYNDGHALACNSIDYYVSKLVSNAMSPLTNDPNDAIFVHMAIENLLCSQSIDGPTRKKIIDGVFE